MHKIPAIENTTAIKGFFAHWNIYHKVMQHNYMSHRQVYGILQLFLIKHFSNKPFSLLDLGCGDAEYMRGALAGTRVRTYTGVDISKVALALAKNNMRRLPCRKQFIGGDFFREIRRRRPADVIWMGITFHHLRLKQKAEFLKQCKKICAPNGRLIVYEPTLREGKDRNDFLERWWRFVSKHWQALTARELLLIKKHIMEDDFPEKIFHLRASCAPGGFYSCAPSLYRPFWRQ